MDKELLDILKEFKVEFKTLNNKIDKNTIMLEQLNKKVEIISEVQTAHKEQNGRDLEKVTIQNTYDVAYLKSVK